jgi:hypothetical protein
MSEVSAKAYPIFAVLALCVACLAGYRACEAGTEPMGMAAADGAVTIAKTPDYYLVTLDFTRGKSHREIGEEYGRSIQKVLTSLPADCRRHQGDLSRGRGVHL